tara:strand:+ start:135 stop:968 length:834 start_codon:yes stop_codon:yes gene_type:complete
MLAMLLGCASGFDNACLPRQLNPPSHNAPATFLAECAAWVVNTTDAVWRPTATDAQVDAALEAYFYSDWSSVGSRGVRSQGMDALKQQVHRTRRAFPDLEIHITDAFCAGNDVDGYKTAMPDVITGTNRGASAYGGATNRRAAYNGIAITYVQRVRGRWQYVAEWVVHDEWAVLDQLDFHNLTAVPHPDSVAAPHDCEVNVPTWGWTPPGEKPQTYRQTDDALVAGVQPSWTMLVGAALLALAVGAWSGFRVHSKQVEGEVIGTKQLYRDYHVLISS